MTKTFVYIFSGYFNSREDACLYSEPQWLLEPDETASDEEYYEWENQNPKHQLRKNIDIRMDTDFIETVAKDYEYLFELKISNYQLNEIREKSINSNYLVLVYEQAFGSIQCLPQPVSNSFLIYCGKYQCFL